MCACNPSIRTPFCGKPGCYYPEINEKKKDSLQGNTFKLPENFGQFVPESTNKRPHICPVCVGSGKRPNGREDGEIMWERCPACKGACVLWG